MQLGRQMLDDNAGRLVAYCPPAGVSVPRSTGVRVRFTSAEDKVVDTDHGLENRRELVVNVTIGREADQLAAVHNGGQFLIDVDDTGKPVPWTIESFANADAGMKRCLCVRPILTTGIVGKRPPDR